MSDSEGFDKVNAVGSVGPKKLVPIGAPQQIEPQSRIAPNKEKFDELMGGKVAPEADSVSSVAAAPKKSLMDEVRSMSGRLDQLAKATPEAIRLQANEVIQRIEDLKVQLKTPDLKLKGSVQRLLNNKLSHIDENLQVALKKVGIEYAPPSDEPQGLSPIQRFIGGLTHSQYQLHNLSSEIEQLQLTGKELTPANMLAMQIKVSYIGQELEFTTSLLNKALESTKTIMNVQV